MVKNLVDFSANYGLFRYWTSFRGFSNYIDLEELCTARPLKELFCKTYRCVQN